MYQISVIIPCFSDSATLKRSLDSILSQTCTVNEIIVVNDASPETIEIEKILFNYPTVVYIKNNNNKGLAASRNIGVNAAAGNIISCLDADDDHHPQKIEAQIALFSPNIAISCQVAQIGNEVGVNRIKIYPSNWKFSIHKKSAPLIKRNTLTGASLLMEKKLFLSIGGYDESLRSCEDFDLWLRLLDAGIPVLSIKLPLYLYRINESGLSRNYLNISKWEIEVLRKYLDGKKSSKIYAKYIYFIWLIKHLVRYEECKNPILLENTIKNIELINESAVFKFTFILILKLRMACLFQLIKKLTIKRLRG